jgi:hypothetical protein
MTGNRMNLIHYVIPRVAMPSLVCEQPELSKVVSPNLPYDLMASGGSHCVNARSLRHEIRYQQSSSDESTAIG